MLLFNITDYLKFWINTIVTYCRGSVQGFPKIMIVLTHKDKIKTEVSISIFISIGINLTQTNACCIEKKSMFCFLYKSCIIAC